MKKTILILIALLTILSSCTADEVTVNSKVPPVISSELAKDLPPIYGDLVFDNETPINEMKICSVKNLKRRIYLPEWQGRSYSQFLRYEDFKDDFEHLYIRRNGDNVYAAARIKYEDEIYYFFITLHPYDNDKFEFLEGRDGALIHEKLLDISTFEDIEPYKTSRKEVKEIDKTAFIYTTSLISSHRLRDGKLIHLIYKTWTGDIPEEEDIIVEKVLIREDEYNFLGKLLPIDREAIT